MLDQIVDLEITVAAVAPTRPAFNVPLLLVYHTKYADRTRSYSDKDELLDDGWTVNDPVYVMAAALSAQSPHPNSFKVGRRALAPTQTIRFFPKNATEGFIYDFYFGPIGAMVHITYTVLAAATVATVTTALELLIEAVGGVASTATATYVEAVVTPAGTLLQWDLQTMDPKDDLVLQDTTADPGLATDLAAIQDADDAWYGILLDSNSEAEINGLAAWIESEKKIAVVQTSDGATVDPAVTTDIASDLVAASITRILLMYSRRKNLLRASAMMGKELAKEPGTSTWALKTLTGDTVDVLRSSHWTNAQAKRVTTYTTIGGRAVTFEGHTPDNSYIDVPHFIDYLHATIQGTVFDWLANNDKIPYTDESVEACRSLVEITLLRFVSTTAKPGALRRNPAPFVTAPLVADVAEADRANRLLPDIVFGAEYAGAVHKVIIRGKIKV